MKKIDADAEVKNMPQAKTKGRRNGRAWKSITGRNS